MVDYSDWKESKLSITYLKLDPLNPRIPNFNASLSQRDLLSELLEKDDVYKLALSIVENGLYPNELLIAVDEGNNRYVVEGNRRLAALKLLFSPESAPDHIWERRFRSLQKRITEPISKVKALIAPTRESAARVIMSRHTIGQIVRWQPLMKSRYYRTLLNRGLSVDDVALEYGVSRADLVRSIRRFEFYRIACGLNLPEEVADKVRDPRLFKVSTFDRLLDYAPFIHAIKADYNAETDSIDFQDKPFTLSIITRVVCDIAKGDKDTRLLNKTEEIDEYIASLLATVDSDDNTHCVSMSSTESSESSNSAEVYTEQSVTTQNTSSRPKKAPRDTKLIPSSFICEVSNSRIQNVVQELKKLPFRNYPNAAAVLLRCLLELSLGHYLNRTKHIGILIKHFRAKRNNEKFSVSDKRQPTLIEMLDYIINVDTTIVVDANLRKTISFLMSQKDSVFSINAMNYFTHNQYFEPNADELRMIWDKSCELFRLLLEDETSFVMAKPGA